MAQTIPSAGVLFSNANHNVIFLNKTLQTMLRYPESAVSAFIGKPVHEILGIPEDRYQQVAKHVIEQGGVDELAVELQARSGQKLTVIAEGIVNKDVRGAIVGIDYTFHETASGLVEVVQTATTIPMDIAHEVVRFYFKRQLEGLYQTMANIGGKKLGDLLNEVVNSTAQRQQWDVTMEGDKITDNAEHLSVESYQGLLYKAASYVSKVLGEAIMTKQVEKVNKTTNPKTFEFIPADWHKQL